MIRSVISIGVVLSALAAPAVAEGDPDAGKKVFNRCKSCHAVGDDAKNKVGPVLTGIVGAPAGTNPDYKYSDALLEKAAEGLVWNVESLTIYLTKPKDLIPKTKMSFPGLKKEADLINLIAYLETFAAN